MGYKIKVDNYSSDINVDDLLDDIMEKNIKDNKDIYGLEDEEAKLVKDGEYEPYNFEEEDLDEDDYYHDDDM